MSNNTNTALLARHIDTVMGKTTNQTLALDTNLSYVTFADDAARGAWITGTAAHDRLIDGTFGFQADTNVLYRYERGANRAADTWQAISAGDNSDRQYGDQHMFASTAARNAANTITWHKNDIAIITDPDPDQVYIYVGANQATPGVTVDGDWLFLGLVETQTISQASQFITITNGASVAGESTTAIAFDRTARTINLPTAASVVRTVYWNGVQLREGAMATGGDFEFNTMNTVITFSTNLVFNAVNSNLTDHIEVVSISISS